MFVVVPAPFGFFSNLFGVAPIAPTTFQNPLSSRARSYLSTFSCSFTSTGLSPGTAIKSVVLLSFSATTISCRMSSVTWPVLIFTSQRIFTSSISVTGAAVCRYHCSERGRPYFSHTLQWTIPATLSCLFLYSSCASLLHSLVKCATVSSLSLYVLHLTSPSCLSIFTLMTLVLNAWSFAAIRIPSVSFFIFRQSQQLLAFVSGTVREAVSSSIYPCAYDERKLVFCSRIDSMKECCNANML